VVGQATIVDRDPVQVMFKRVADEESAIGQGIAEVEEAVGSLRGRKCYGAFEDGEYQACVQVREGDDPAAIGLEVGELPGGRYARIRLKGEPPDLYQQIGPTFERLAQRPDRDTSRPGIEFYRRHDVIDLLLPID
jgi:effector-binding domain-containing protein